VAELYTIAIHVLQSDLVADQRDYSSSGWATWTNFSRPRV